MLLAGAGPPGHGPVWLTLRAPGWLRWQLPLGSLTTPRLLRRLGHVLCCRRSKRCGCCAAAPDLLLPPAAYLSKLQLCLSDSHAAVEVLRLPVRRLLHVLLAPTLDLLAVAGKFLQLLSQFFLNLFQLFLGKLFPVLLLMALLEKRDFLLRRTTCQNLKIHKTSLGHPYMPLLGHPTAQVSTVYLKDF